jgi:hypothetical protein
MQPPRDDRTHPEVKDSFDEHPEPGPRIKRMLDVVLVNQRLVSGARRVLVKYRTHQFVPVLSDPPFLIFSDLRANPLGEREKNVFDVEPSPYPEEIGNAVVKLESVGQNGNNECDHDTGKVEDIVMKDEPN